MKKLLIGSTLLALGVMLTPAYALTRVWISGHGADNPGCGGVTAPCRTIQFAHDNVAPGGEIDVLDPAGYGTLVITKAINVINHGAGTAGVLASPGGNAITINATSTDDIVLSGLTIEGVGTGLNGIQINAARSVGLGSVSISGFTGIGINFVPNIGANMAYLAFQGSSYSNAGGGIVIKPTGGTIANVTLSDCVVTNGATFDGSGSSAGSVQALINNCVIRNATNAIVATAQSTDGSVFVEINKSAVSHAPNAITANGAKAFVELNLSTLTLITTVATVTSGGTINSYGNNAMGFVGTIGPLGSVSLH